MRNAVQSVTWFYGTHFLCVWSLDSSETFTLSNNDPTAVAMNNGGLTLVATLNKLVPVKNNQWLSALPIEYEALSASFLPSNGQVAVGGKVVHTHACTHACTHTRTHARTHAHTHTQCILSSISPGLQCLHLLYWWWHTHTTTPDHTVGCGDHHCIPT